MRTGWVSARACIPAIVCDYNSTSFTKHCRVSPDQKGMIEAIQYKYKFRFAGLEIVFPIMVIGSHDFPCFFRLETLLFCQS
jgi:hypothetical protein